MNRQLKFRIWNKQHKTWLENDASLHCFSNWSICPFTGKLTDYVGVISSDFETYSASPAPDYYTTADGIVNESPYVIQQFTGLKDSNEKEIYEGDILKWHQGNNNLSEVIYENGSFFVKGINWGAYWYLGDYNNVYEVIGNIFENPELLK